MKKKKSLHKNILFKDSAFFKIYMLTLIPTLITLIFSFVNVYSINKNQTQLLKQSYISKLEAINSKNEMSLQNISIIIRMLSENNSFMSALKANDYTSQEAYIVSDLLSQVRNNNPLIDSIIIYNRNADIVYTDVGISNANNYFEYNYNYAEYSRDFWRMYNSLLSESQTLGPSLVSTQDKQKTVMPIVFTKIGQISINSLIIVNVNLSELIEDANNQKFSENSTFFIVNKQSKVVFPKDEVYSLLNNEFFDNISKQSFSVFYYRLLGNKSLFISYSPNDSILGYSYVAQIPYSDITQTFYRSIAVILMIWLLLSLAVIFIAYISSRKIFEPIENMASLFKEHKSNKAQTVNPSLIFASSSRDTFSQLHTSIKETLDLNTSLLQQVSKSLPLIQEQKLIRFLNYNEYYIPTEDELDMNFRYEFFCSIVIKLQPTDDFYKMYNNMEYNQIRSGIHAIIQTSFAEKYDSYIITSEIDTLYVLLNLPPESDTESILEILKNFRQAMGFDKVYMNLKIGVGGIYPHMTGLKKSHHEAINSISGTVDFTSIKVHSDKNEEFSQNFDFNINDENAFFNNLVTGRISDAEAILERVLNENIQNNISTEALTQLYFQILNILFKVMRTKRIIYDTDDCGDVKLINEIIQKPTAEIRQTISSYISNISKCMYTQHAKTDIQTIISYIETHYKEDFGLDDIAHRFNTTPKYISKFIKDKLGINFTDYVASLRINATKEMLVKTDMTISEIYKEAGFNNRNTFIRTFRKNTGLTPTEYRKNKKQL